MKSLIKKYVDAGVREDKIVVTKSPSICTWSLTRKCLVNENGVDPLELVDGVKLTYENNRQVLLQNNIKLDVDKINESEGIIVGNVRSGKPYFRFQYIPTK